MTLARNLPGRGPNLDGPGVSSRDQPVRLSGGPGQGPAGEHVKMDMKNALAGVRTSVHDHPKAIRAVPGLHRQPRASEHELAEELGVLGKPVGEGRDVAQRNHQQMQGRPGGDVLESLDVIVPVDDGGRDLLVADLAEETIAFAHGTPSSIRCPFRSITAPAVGSSHRKSSSRPWIGGENQ